MGTGYQIHKQEAVYFITLQVVGWADVFTRKSYRDVVIDSFAYCQKEKGLIIYAYVIMSNHVHLIVKSNKSDLSGTIRDMKKHIAKQIFKQIDESDVESRKEWLNMIFKYHAKKNKRSDERQFWTHENHAVELNTNELIESKINYIHDNPVRAGWVINAEDFLYSSARNYAELDNLLQIERI